MTDSTSDPTSDVAEQAQRAIERARAAHRRAAEVLTASAALADAHAIRAEAKGDLDRAAFEREVASRVRATVARLGDGAASGPRHEVSPDAPD